MTHRNLYLRAAEGDEEAEREVLSRLLRRHRPSRKDLCAQVVAELLPEAIEAYRLGAYREAYAKMRDIVDVSSCLECETQWFRVCATLCKFKAAGDVWWHGWWPAEVQQRTFVLGPDATNTALAAMALGRQTGNTGTVEAMIGSMLRRHGFGDE